MLSNVEIGCFVNLFNRGGYVLNFTTADFDAFTFQQVGIPLCSRYKLPKTKSLLAFVEDAENEEVAKLLFALLEYYEIYYQKEYETPDEAELGYSAYDAERARLYSKCREFRDRELSDLFQHRQSSCVHKDEVFQRVHAGSNRPADGDENQKPN